MTELDKLIDFYDSYFDPIDDFTSDKEFSNWLNIIDETIEDGLTIHQAIDTLNTIILNLIDKEYYEWCRIVKNKIDKLEAKL